MNPHDGGKLEIIGEVLLVIAAVLLSLAAIGAAYNLGG